ASAVALRTLHKVDLPLIKDVADDRPLVSAAISRRLQDTFGAVTEDDSFWTGLSSEDRPKLEYVRAKYETYAPMLPALQVSLADTECALTHGDLSGDNLMVRQDGSFALTDWGETRITSSLTDVAYLLTHTEWNKSNAQRFLRAYFNDDPRALEEALPVVETLSRLYQYNSCVRSLLWLNSPEGDGLDSIGRAYFERQLRAL
ncbi:MAG: aminoglycoside phosphotransferase family protein, partial [Chloroflexi bacterium]|nr:aminoglycoside phosphotransferase family protein [Chloroflexota bacterium]